MSTSEIRAPHQMSRRTVIVLVGVAIVLHAWPLVSRLFDRTLVVPAFVIDLQSPSEPGALPVCTDDFVTPEAAQAHVASLCETLDGRLVCAWYSGSAEGAKDVCIYTADRDPFPGSAWSEPRIVVSRESAAMELGRYVRKIGNSVIFTDQEGRSWLVYVSVSVGGWSGSSLNVKTSDDGGDTWTRSRRLTLSPFFNVSELVKAKPLHLENGGVALPIYHESIGLFPEILWMRGRPDADLRWSKSRIAGGRSFIQPALVALTRTTAVAVFRCWSPRRAVAVARTSDGGRTWTEPTFTDVPNPNSAVAALLLSGGRILIVFNDHEVERDSLRLAVSADGGSTWARVATVEEDAENRFSYPYVIRTRDGLIHIVYTWHGKRIKHVAFNEAWIEAQLRHGRSKEALR